MVDRTQSDIPQVSISTPASSDVMMQYAKFFASYGQSVLDYAQAYTSNRLVHARRTLNASAVSDPMMIGIKTAQAALLRRVLYEAQFTPAHPERYSLKSMGQVEYFILHRPGHNPKACTLSNTVLSFLIPPTLDGNKTQSTHFIIGPQGQLVQLIDLDDAAHHIGENGKHNNRNSVGVEITGAITEPVTDAQFERTVRLIADMSLIAGFPIDSAHILKHSTLAPATRKDPGPHLNYARVLSEASRVRATLSSTRTIYKSPFDPASAVYKDIATILDAANAVLGPGRKSLRLSSAARIESIFRADQMTRATRDKLLAAARTHYERIASNQAADVANRTFQERQAQEAEEILATMRAVATASAAVVGYNLLTGLWSDGSQV